MGTRITVHALLKMMFAVCMGGMLGVSAFVWIVTKEIVFRHKAGQFLKTLSGVPKNPFLGLLFIVFCILIFALTYGLRQQFDSINLAYASLLFDFLLGIVCVVFLHYNYNGIFLWIIANTLLYMKKNRGMLVIMILGIGAYLITTPDIAAFSRNRYEIGRYIETLAKHSQTWFFGIYNLLTILTIVVFILCCVVIIVSKEEIIEKNAQLNRRLQEANEELQQANAELENFLEENARLAEIRERNRIAREIHDTLGHTLTGIAAGLDACIALSAESSPVLKNQLNLLSEASRKGIKDIRLSVSSLRPDAPQRFHLKHALETLMENTRKMTHTDIEFCCLIEKLRYDEDEENAVYRIIQESLTNAIRHGRAKHIRVFMENREGSIYLKVEDDGIGCSNIEAGFGLRHIRERIKLLRGQVNFSGEKGFTVEALIPIRWGENYD